MSLQFSGVTAGPIVSLSLGCSSGASRHVTTPPSITAPSADLIADTRLLEQLSNAARLDALQGLHGNAG